MQTMFGGSVQKGTYVTGLSDVDVLLDSEPVFAKEQASLEGHSLRGRYDHPTAASQESRQRKGKLAVTVSYSDKTEIQILPAIRTTTDGVPDRGTRKHQVEQRRASRALCREARQSEQCKGTAE